MEWIWPMHLQSIELLGEFHFLFLFTLLMFFRANATFSFFADEVHVALDNGDFPCLRNVIPEVAFASVQVLLLGLVVRWLESMVGFFLSLFLEYLLTMCCSRSLWWATSVICRVTNVSRW